MKFYLSSYRIPHLPSLLALLGKQPSDVRMAVVPNAKDYYAERARNVKIKKLLADFEVHGFRPTVFDLSGKTPKQVRALLKDLDFVWVAGGNTFCLREAMQASGFDTLIKTEVARGLVYGGDSAGAIIAGPTLKGVEWADEPEFAGTVLFEGLHLVPDVVIPHADSTMFGDAIVRMIELYQHHESACVLNDNQVLVIDGASRQVFTADPVPEI